MTRLSLDVLRDEKAPVIALVAVVLKRYGAACIEWQPEFLRDEIQNDFGVDLSDLQSDKIQAGLVVLTTDLFESQWEVFKTICHLLNSTADTFEDVSPLEAEELATAIAHYKLLIADDEAKGRFSDEVRKYAGIVFFNYGMTEAPAIFPTALMPDFPEPASPVEKNQALSELFDAKTAALKDYVTSLKSES